MEHMIQLIKKLGNEKKYASIKLILDNKPELQDLFDEIAFELLSKSGRINLTLLNVLLPLHRRLSSTTNIPHKLLFDQAVLNHHLDALPCFFTEAMLQPYSDAELGKILFKLIHAHKTKIANELLNLRPHIVKDECDDYLDNMLHLMMQQKKPDAKLLLKLYENNPASSSLNKYGKTPLLIGIENKHYALLKQLCQHADILEKHSIAQLVEILIILSEDKQYDLIKLILEKKPDLQNHTQQIAFALFTKPKFLFTSEDVVELELLNILLPNNKPLMPNLMPANVLFRELIQRGNFIAIKYFLDESMLPLYSDQELGKLLFDLIDHSEIRLAKQCMERRPTLYKNHVNSNHDNALHIALGSPHSYNGGDMLPDWELISTLFLNNDEGLMQLNHDEKTPLLSAAICGHFDFITRICKETDILMQLPLKQMIKLLEEIGKHNVCDLTKLILAKRPELYNHAEDIACHIFLSHPRPIPEAFFDVLLSQNKPLSNKTLLDKVIENKDYLVLKYLLDTSLLPSYTSIELEAPLKKLLKHITMSHYVIVERFIQQWPDMFHRALLECMTMPYEVSGRIIHMLCNINPTLAAMPLNGETLLLTCAKYNFFFFKELCHHSALLNAHTTEDLIKIVHVLETKKYKGFGDWIDVLTNHNAALKEAVHTKRLFGLKDLTRASPMISREKLKYTLENLLEKDMTTENLIIFLKAYLKLPAKMVTFSNRLFHKPDHSMQLSVVQKLLQHVTEGKRLDLSSADLSVLMRSHSLSKKIIRTFLFLNELSQLRGLLGEHARCANYLNNI